MTKGLSVDAMCSKTRRDVARKYLPIALGVDEECRLANSRDVRDKSAFEEMPDHVESHERGVTFAQIRGGDSS